MFSERIIQRNIERVEQQMSALLTQQRGTPTRFNIIHFPPADIEEMVQHLKTITIIDSRDEHGVTDWHWSRALTIAEKRFVENEQIMCQLSMRHYAENYAYIQLAGRGSDRPEGWDELDEDAPKRPGGDSNLVIGKFLFNGMQESLHRKMIELEEREFDAFDRGAPVNGMLLITLKARALGASAYWQVVGFCRTQFFSNINALTASMDDGNTQRMHRRYERLYENSPPWLVVPQGIRSYKHWTKDRGVTLANGSMMELQDGMQKTDLGKSEAWHFWHVTEASMFPRPEDHFDEGLFPATLTGMIGGFPVIAGLETTAKGKLGWFKDFWDQVYSGASDSAIARSEGGAGRFDWFFAPFYLIDIHEQGQGQRSKYRMESPPDWRPADITLAMARKVLETSPDYTPDGRAVDLHKDVLYWWENTRRQYYKKGRLNIFKQSYPITHDEAFQHTAAGAFSSETIERLDLDTARLQPYPYKLMTGAEAADYRIAPYRFKDDAITPLPIYEQSGYYIGPMHESELDRDPRGIIFFWELPDERPRNYYVGCDPTGGIPNWSRAFREQGDVGTDNGVVQVWLKESAAVPCDDCKSAGWLPTSTPGVQAECRTCDARGRVGGRVVQCAEFAAPIDAEDLALYVFLLGRLYKTLSDFEEAKAIILSANTGILTIRSLQNTYNYSNLWQSRTIDGAAPKFTRNIGFAEGPTTVPVLHARGKSAAMKRDVLIRSKWLVKELSDAIVKIYPESGRERFYVPPGGGRHDDRMSTAFASWWAAFDWYESDGSEAADQLPGAQTKQLPDYAARDVSAEDQNRMWNEAVEQRVGGADLSFEEHGEWCVPGCEGCAFGEPDPNDDIEDDEREEYGDD